LEAEAIGVQAEAVDEIAASTFLLTSSATRGIQSLLFMRVNAKP